MADGALRNRTGDTSPTLIHARIVLSWRQQLKSRFFAGGKADGATICWRSIMRMKRLRRSWRRCHLRLSEEWPRFELQQQAAFRLAVAFRDQLIRQRSEPRRGC